MKRCKKDRWVILLLIILLTISMVGCTSKNNQSAQDGALNIDLIGVTLGGGGVWDLIATGIAETIQQTLPGSVITSIPGEGVSNVVSIHNNEAELGLTHSSIAVDAHKGAAPFSEEITDVKAIASLYGSGLQFITRSDLPFDSIQDMIDNKYKIKLAVGSPGSTGELATSRMLGEYGVTYGDIESWGGKIYFRDMGDATDMLGDGLIDAITLLTIAPAGPVQEVSSSQDVKMLSVDEYVINELMSKYGYTNFDISKFVYNFTNEDITTFGSQVILVVNDAMPNREAYSIVKALVGNLDYLHTVHANIQDLTVEKMAEKTGAPLHPGAEEYYKEAEY